jgi:gamma-glutamyltranspeptidase/glutathione hydrolase
MIQTDSRAFGSCDAAVGTIRRRAAVVIGLFLASAIQTLASAQSAPVDLVPSLTFGQAQTATARSGMVASQDALATKVGVDILSHGGNAVDAAVAVGFTLAATLPRAGNLGGGGFMIIHLANRPDPIAIDYRESAPAATSRDIFLDDKGNADPEKSRNSGLAIGVPGTVAGLALAHSKYGSGKFTLADLIAPAIKYAREGVPLENDLLDSLLLSSPRLMHWPSSAKIFAHADGASFKQGEILVQSDLAASLERIAHDGLNGFYSGPTAERIVATARTNNGLMTLQDLQNYRAIERTPLRGTYRGYEIISMPPPSSGGTHLIEMLNILEGFPLGDDKAGLGFGQPQALHLMIEAMKLAYADRAKFLGDSDAVDVPIAELTAKSYAEKLRAGIDLAHARAALVVSPNNPATGGGNTTHYSVVDKDGNAVANTYSLNFNYGLGLVADGTGILLNNTMDDFAAKPGAPNAFGLVGGAANAPGPNKRPLSSMTPTIVLKDGKPFIVTGAPGGSRIITAVLQVIMNVIDFKQAIGDAVTAPRVHHQWLPDQVLVERTLPAETVHALETRGHIVRIGPPSGSAHSIAATPGGLVGAADGRARGGLAAGY